MCFNAINPVFDAVFPSLSFFSHQKLSPPPRLYYFVNSMAWLTPANRRQNRQVPPPPALMMKTRKPGQFSRVADHIFNLRIRSLRKCGSGFGPSETRIRFRSLRKRSGSFLIIEDKDPKLKTWIMIWFLRNEDQDLIFKKRRSESDPWETRTRIRSLRKGGSEPYPW